jgi:hypothetical protein
MRTVLLLALTFGPTYAQSAAVQDNRLTQPLQRVAAVARLFAQTAQQYLCQETLRQRVIRGNSIRKKKGDTVPLVSGTPQYNQREIVSYYAFTTLGKSPAVHEVRQILTVDKERLAKDFEGRNVLRNALLSRNDQVKNQLLNGFEPEALNGVAMDLGQMILLFDANGIKNFTFDYDREETVRGNSTMVIRYSQKGGAESVHIIDHGRQAKAPLRGWLWVRLPDFLPVGMTMISSRTEKKHEIRDEAEVDYAENSDGALLPSAVLHRRYEDDILAAEDDFKYTNWQSLK